MSLTTDFENGTLNIRRTKTLTEAEYKKLFAWDEDVFGDNSSGIEWREKDLHFLLDSPEGPICHVGVIEDVVHVGDEGISIGGIGGVVCTPEAQGKGYTQMLMRYVVAYFANEALIPFGFLFCWERLEAFYKKLGWQTLADEVIVELPSGRGPIPRTSMFLPCSDKTWPAGKVEIHSKPW